MKSIFHKSAERGHADHGWLNAWHSFSFANWYDPDKVHFGALRVVNDDRVAAAMGFGMHPHANMEIVTIPLSGALQHRDSMGNEGVIRAGEIQIMSAGKGIYHSEMNASQQEEVTLFQIWVIPDKQSVEPRYQQFSYDLEAQRNQFLQLVSPSESDAGGWIHQQAWFHYGQFDAGQTIRYSPHAEKNGLYILQVDGSSEIAGQNLQSRDAMGLWQVDSIEIKTKQDGRILLIEVPMYA